MSLTLRFEWAVFKRLSTRLAVLGLCVAAIPPAWLYAEAAAGGEVPSDKVVMAVCTAFVAAMTLINTWVKRSEKRGGSATRTAQRFLEIVDRWEEAGAEVEDIRKAYMEKDRIQRFLDKQLVEDLRREDERLANVVSSLKGQVDTLKTDVHRGFSDLGRAIDSLTKAVQTNQEGATS